MSENTYPQRKLPRLKDFDYASEGAYFVTICTQNRLPLFGIIEEDQMHPNDAGKMIQQVWDALPSKFAELALDTYVVMPNHFHGIIILVGNAQRGIPPSSKSNSIPETDDHAGSSLQKINLSDIVHWFKTMTTNAYIRGVKENNWQRFPKKLWQHSYYDHIIRNEVDLHHIQNYIINNPTKWAEDSLFIQSPTS
ncbi:MAG: transposase [Aggregatilineales bacterium]